MGRWDPDWISRYRSELMGIAALWIVFFHSAIPVPENIVLRLLWYGIVGFGGGLGVNIFILLSGYGLMFSHCAKSCCADMDAVKGFIVRRFKRVLIPYFVIAGFYFLVRCICSGTDFWTFLEDITLLSFVTRGDRTYWYIFAILVLYCTYPPYMKLAQRFGQGRTCVVAVAGIVVLECIVYKCFPTGYERFEIFILRCPLFFMGSYLGYLAQASSNPHRKKVVAGMAVLALLCMTVYAAAFLKQCADLRAQRYLFIPVSIGVVIALTCIFCRIPVFNGFLRMFGKHSLGVYLIHIPLYQYAAVLEKATRNPYGVCLSVAVISLLGAMGLDRLTCRIGQEKS